MCGRHGGVETRFIASPAHDVVADDPTLSAAQGQPQSSKSVEQEYRASVLSEHKSNEQGRNWKMAPST